MSGTSNPDAAVCWPQDKLHLVFLDPEGRFYPSEGVHGLATQPCSNATACSSTSKPQVGFRRAARASGGLADGPQCKACMLPAAVQRLLPCPHEQRTPTSACAGPARRWTFCTSLLQATRSSLGAQAAGIPA